MARSGLGTFGAGDVQPPGSVLDDDDDDYLSPDERRRRAAEKRRELNRVRLTPDWFVGQGLLCLPPGMRVAVIGGGFAGMAAAWYLDACGVQVTVYEAADRLGGRVLTDRTVIPGKNSEFGAELIGENHALWGRLAIDFGLTLTEITDEDEYDPLPGRPPPALPRLIVRLIFGGHVFTPDEKRRLKNGLKPFLRDIGNDAKLIHPRLPWLSPRARRFDGMSVADKLDQMIGLVSSDERTWFEFMLDNDNCAHVSRQSYLGLLTAVSAGRMPPVPPAPIDDRGMLGYWNSTETHVCADGNQELANAIARSIEARNSRILVSTPVTQVEVARNYCPAVTITAGGRTEFYDEAVLAAAPTVWSAINFVPALTVPFRRIQQGPAVKFMSRYDTRCWEADGFAPLVKSDAQGSVWETTDKKPPRPATTPRGFGLTAYSGGSFVMPGTAYAPALAALYPSCTPTGSHFADWPNTPFVMTGYGVPAPGQVRNVMQFQPIPHVGHLYFAGEQTSPGFFGYMEGALQSGARAARDIVIANVRLCP